MGLIGYKSGPPKSEIVATLGPDYFGLSPAEFWAELESHRDEEARGVVDPLDVDEDGRPYVTFLRGGEKRDRYYLNADWFKDVLDVIRCRPGGRERLAEYIRGRGRG